MVHHSENVDFVHLELNKEHSTIGGYYYILKQDRLSLNDKEILYLIGSGVYDNYCCGGGTCGYALVPGVVIDWEYKNDPGGQPVSRVEPVKDDDLRREITRIIKKKENVSQVVFH